MNRSFSVMLYNNLYRISFFQTCDLSKRRKEALERKITCKNTTSMCKKAAVTSIWMFGCQVWIGLVWMQSLVWLGQVCFWCLAGTLFSAPGKNCLGHPGLPKAAGCCLFNQRDRDNLNRNKQTDSIAPSHICGKFWRQGVKCPRDFVRDLLSQKPKPDQHHLRPRPWMRWQVLGNGCDPLPFQEVHGKPERLPTWDELRVQSIHALLFCL